MQLHATQWNILRLGEREPVSRMQPVRRIRCAAARQPCAESLTALVGFTLIECAVRWCSAPQLPLDASETAPLVCARVAARAVCRAHEPKSTHQFSEAMLGGGELWPRGAAAAGANLLNGNTRESVNIVWDKTQVQTQCKRSNITSKECGRAAQC